MGDKWGTLNVFQGYLKGIKGVEIIFLRMRGPSIFAS